MKIETLSTFPGMFDSVMGTSIMRIAQEKGILEFMAYDLRNWTHDKHRTTDDYPFGGGQGLVMKPEPIFEAYDDIAKGAGSTGAAPWPATAYGATPAAAPEPAVDGGTGVLPWPATAYGSTPAPEQAANEGVGSTGAAPLPYTIFLTPTGQPFNDALANELAQKERLLFICGHYEGIDERVYSLADACISLGDYVLSSGELASMVVIDAVVRKLPGVLGNDASALDESFSGSLLEYPQYTRPASYRGMDVPEVLLSGDHAAVDAWRRRMSIERTARLRPDLLASADLSPEERSFLEKLSPDTD